MMCLSVLPANESLAPLDTMPEAPLLGMSLLTDCPVGENQMDTSLVGKRRKMSKTDSPNSSCFDVAQLIDSIHLEVEGDVCLGQPKDQLSTPPSPEENRPTVSFSADDFDFIDIPETPVAEEPLALPELPQFEERRGSLGKRSRGLARSQTFKTGLSLLGETQ